MKTEPIGVLLFNLGGPEKLADVKPFLYNLFSDPEIIRIKFAPLRKAVAYTIATLRNKKSQGYYSQIGGGSPLRRLTEDQAVALRDELQRQGLEAETFVGMCTWNPFFPETLDRIEKSNVRRLVILPLFPQFSVTTTGSGFALLKQLIERRPRIKQLNTSWVRSWHDHPTYIASFTDLVQRVAGALHERRDHRPRQTRGARCAGHTDQFRLGAHRDTLRTRYPL
jgi:ferrochelatase